MCRRYGSKERAKRELFVRSASFHYMGNGRYGYAAASEYYFGKPLSGYTQEDAGKAALLAGITKSPRDYAPSPGDPRPLHPLLRWCRPPTISEHIPGSLACGLILWTHPKKRWAAPQYDKERRGVRSGKKDL